ncbi:hypothetical protein Pla22_10930 [Rubripirellula amarantea]|uniref:Uncharacterized protein n=1 Tax=Rubripirellula amarantea TaxID=2527999 RepID=A0A5C5WRD9_9BACT|nr:hypothetical protein Pla22_10930 [Rubripirellula amarantea]
MLVVPFCVAAFLRGWKSNDLYLKRQHKEDEARAQPYRNVLATEFALVS